MRLILGKNLRTSKNAEIPKTYEHMRLNQFLLVLIKKRVYSIRQVEGSQPAIHRKIKLPLYISLRNNFLYPLSQHWYNYFTSNLRTLRLSYKKVMKIGKFKFEVWYLRQKFESAV